MQNLEGGVGDKYTVPSMIMYIHCLFTKEWVGSTLTSPIPSPMQKLQYSLVFAKSRQKFTIIMHSNFD